MTPNPRLSACCLVNHYNYKQFVEATVDSAVDQSRSLDEILVVDDGSCEEDLAEVRRVALKHPEVQLLEKPNGGQLSCFEAGINASKSDVVFFLDADDRWDPRYVETVMALLERRPDIDFVATNDRREFSDGRTEVTERSDRDLGYSITRSLKNGGAFLGQPTSCLAIRREILERIFPLPQVRGWRTCADEALVYGSSLVGARKFFLAEPLVRYRIHGENHWFGKKYSASDRLLRGLEVQRLVEVLRRREGLPACLAHIAHHEFRTIESPTSEDYSAYQRLVGSSSIGWRRKLRIKTALFTWHRLGMRT